MGVGWDSKSPLCGAAILRTSTLSTSSNHLFSARKNNYVNVTLGDEKDIHAEAAMHQTWQGSIVTRRIGAYPTSIENLVNSGLPAALCTYGELLVAACGSNERPEHSSACEDASCSSKLN